MRYSQILTPTWFSDEHSGDRGKNAVLADPFIPAWSTEFSLKPYTNELFKELMADLIEKKKISAFITIASV